jgi:hypothetical protein
MPNDQKEVQIGTRFLFLVLLVLITQTLFFEIYRGAAFNILPHDD